MIHSIFDPEGGETEHSGSRNLGPTADNLSHMPTDVVDGQVSDEEMAERKQSLAGETKADGDPVHALEQMSRPASGSKPA